MNDEETPDGYPGFRVAGPPCLRLVGATLSRIALAKLAGITMLSASFDGERHSFEPWLTALIEYDRQKVLAGVYRTDDAESPTFCLRHSAWDQDTDARHVSDMASLRDHLVSGPQIADTFTFATGGTHPDLDRVMNDALSILTKGISIEPTTGRAVDWVNVAVELADDRFACSVDYSPLIARSEALETALPPWLAAVERLARDPGLPPDDVITLTIKRSVPELTTAQPFARHLDHKDLKF